MPNPLERLIARLRPDPAPEALLASVDEPFRGVLLSMYRGEPQRGADGQAHPIDRATAVKPAEGLWLYQLCLERRPAATLEIGLGWGYSALFMLAAHARNGGGRHTAIDPQQRSWFHGVALAHAEKCGAAAFRFIEERSDRAATDLARAGEAFDLVFIDGNHRFDDALTDFYLYAPLCRRDGLIVLDDLWMPSIQSVASFVRRNREDFVEVRVPERNVAVFRRVGDDVRPWDHFRGFSGG